MKYVSIDIETTGRDPKRHQILEIGAIIEDTKLKLPFEECPKFHRLLYHNEIIGEPFALAMNADLIKKISGEYQKLSTVPGYKSNLAIFSSEVIRDFLLFLTANKLVSKVTAAGKNFGSFDRLFLNELPNGNALPLNYRSIDPAMYFIEWEFDAAVPDSMTCKERAAVKPQMLHRAIEDAWDMIQLLRTQY